MELRSLPRWLGWMWAVGGAVTVVVALTGAVVGWILIGSVGQTVTDTVGVTKRVLVGVSDTTRVVDEVFSDVAVSLRGVQTTLADSSLTLTRASAVTRSLGSVITEQVPDSVDAVRDSLPALIGTAGVIDSAMRGLSFFGVNYNVEVPLDESLEEIDRSLAEIPVLLRAQQDNLAGVAADLGDFSSDALTIGDDVGSIRVRLAEAATVLAGYDSIVSDSTDLLEELETTARNFVAVLRFVVVALALGVAVTQTAPITFGLAILGRPAAATDATPAPQAEGWIDES
jgi:hypothetical protein